MSNPNPKISVDYILFAENVVSGERGKASLINIFDNIFVRDLPSAHVPIFGVASIRIGGENQATNHKVDIMMTNPQGDAFIKLDTQEMKSTGEDTFFLNLVINLAPLPIAELGDYEFLIKLDGKKVASRVLKVSKES